MQWLAFALLRRRETEQEKAYDGRALLTTFSHGLAQIRDCGPIGISHPRDFAVIAPKEMGRGVNSMKYEVQRSGTTGYHLQAECQSQRKPRLGGVVDNHGGEE